MTDEFETCPDCGTLILPPMRHVHSAELRRPDSDDPIVLSDGVLRWIAENPYLPTTLRDFIVPKHNHLIEVGGFPFTTLAEAQAFASKYNYPTIECRVMPAEKKAV